MGKITGQGYLLQIDVSITQDGSAYVDVDPISVGESLNEAVDTYFKLSKGGFASNKVVSLDPQWDVTIKAETENNGLAFIVSKRFAIARGVKIRITDNLTNEIISFDAELTAIGSTREIGSVIELPIAFKLSDGVISVDAAPAPVALVITPSIADNDGDIAIDAVIDLVANVSLDQSTITTANVILTEDGIGRVDATLVYDDNTKTLTITPLADLNNSTQYTLVVTQDLKGIFNAELANEIIVNFTTIA